MAKNFEYWVELSDYDFETANVMFKGKRYLYVGFMAHQAIEKILKAYFVKTTGKTPPFSHRLSMLAKKAFLYESFSDAQKDFIDILEPMNIEARYPTNKKQLFKSLTEERCRSIIKQTEELQLWIKKKLYEN
ncbi:MAG: HEPN domain-containing protein [Desulfobacteraceae bacterium]